MFRQASKKTLNYTNLNRAMSIIKAPVGTKVRMQLRSNELVPGYTELHNRMHTMLSRGVTAFVLSPTLAAFWLLFTEQTLSESPVAIAALGIGGFVVANSTRQFMRVKEYAKLSILTSPTGPALSPEINQEIKLMIAGLNPQINFQYNGLSIAGNVGDLSVPSTAKEDAITTIKNKDKVVLPLCTLTAKAIKLTDLTHERWLARIAFPFAILNILAIAMKDPKDRGADDYVVFAASAYSAYDYLSGPSVATAREKFTKMLANSKNPQELIRTLVENNIVDEGGMSFLNEWVKDQKSIGVRVARTGSPVLYKNRDHSYGGPYPLKKFPEEETSPTHRLT